MRLKNLILGDIKFQLKYGFYFVYLVFTCFYIVLINLFPKQWREMAAIIMIFSDPAAMGLFFMGAIILLEKSQRVLNSIAVSPVKVWEYILSKVISLGFIATLVGLLLAIAAGENNINDFILIVLGTFLGSVIFTLLGLIVAANINSLNQFLIATVPFELIIFLPPMLYLYGYHNLILRLHPGSIIIQLLLGKSESLVLNLTLLAIFIGLLFLVTCRVLKRMFQSVGGIKL